MKERNEVILKTINRLLKEEKTERVIAVLGRLYPADAAEIVGSLDEEHQKAIFERWAPDQSASAFLELEEGDQVDIAENLTLNAISEILNEMPADDAADLVADLSGDLAENLLKSVRSEVETEIRALLKYGEDTAGGLMIPEAVTLKKNMTAEEAIDELRRMAPNVESIYYIFVINDENQLVGVVSLRDLIIAPASAMIKDIMNPDVIYVEATADQEETAKLISKYDLLALPVVDGDNHLLGVVTVDDVLDVVEDEATEDIYRLAGLTKEEKIASPVMDSFLKRVPWMVLNLGTAFLASSVVGLFEESISSVVTLAVFMPIVAGMGGNGGTQALAVTTRGIALGELELSSGLKALFKEGLIGLMIGLTTGLITAIVAFYWKGNVFLGLVLFLAMIINLLIAGLSGAGIPILLKRLGYDPALGSGIIITTFTDVFGFLAFLGLATFFLKYLI